MLAPTLTTLRVFLHLVAAAIWVGGQFALAGIVPSVLRMAPETGKTMARAFVRMAWPAFAVMVITGMWNLFAIDTASTSTAYQITLLVKITVAIVSGVAAAVHAVGQSRLAKASGGAIGLLGGLAALYLGVLLANGA